MKKIQNSWRCLVFLFALPCSVIAQNNTIFFGGIGDGGSTGNYAQQFEDIRKGGTGDGAASVNYAQEFTDIRKGGMGDGSASNAYTQEYSDVRKGGIGDGWASNIIPLQPLPLTLLSFTGKDVDGSHQLTWQTTNESNTSYFILEYTTQSSVSYKALTRLEAAGNTTSSKEYSFVNRSPSIGDNFYRLKMVDIDGKETFSNVVLLKVLSNKTAILFYPNPTADVLNVVLGKSIDNSAVHLQIFDMAGKQIATHELKNDSKQFSLDVSQFTSGNYVIRIINNGNTDIIKFSKIN